jgi:hypothetical protein
MRRACEIFIIGVFAVLLGTGPVLADCFHNGKQVPEGTRVGVLVCENGKWVEKR